MTRKQKIWTITYVVNMSNLRDCARIEADRAPKVIPMRHACNRLPLCPADFRVRTLCSPLIRSTAITNVEHDELRLALGWL